MAWTFELVHGPLGRPLGGLAWDGKGMLVSDIDASTILRWDPEKKAITTARKYTNRTNGIAFGRDRVLYGSQSGARRIVRYMPDRSANVLATRLAGRVHNNPYFLAVDGDERIWFSDRDHSALATGPGPQRFPPLEHESVLRLTRSSRGEWRLERMTFDTCAPTGVALAADGKTLYVAENNMQPGGSRELRAYPVDSDGTLGSYLVLHTFGADRRGIHRGIEGMCVDSHGNIVACAGWQKSGPGPLICVFSATGAVIETHPVPGDLPLNCAFGGEDLASLYVTTAAGHLFHVENVARMGYAPFAQR